MNSTLCSSHSRADAGQVAGGRHEHPGLALDRLEQDGGGVGVIAASSASASPYLHRHEARCVRAVVVVRDRVVGERDDGHGAAVEVAAGDDDLGAFLRHALDLVRPLAGDLDRRLDGLGAGVHRQHHLGAGQLGQLLRRTGRAGRGGTPGEVSVTRPSCSIAAAISSGCRWPKFSAE